MEIASGSVRENYTTIRFCMAKAIHGHPQQRAIRHDNSLQDAQMGLSDGESLIIQGRIGTSYYSILTMDQGAWDYARARFPHAGTTYAVKNEDLIFSVHAPYPEKKSEFSAFVRSYTALYNGAVSRWQVEFMRSKDRSFQPVPHEN